MYAEGGRGEARTLSVSVPFRLFGFLSFGQAYISTNNICTVLYKYFRFYILILTIPLF